METGNVFIINMKKDIGRKMNISNLQILTNAVYWEGIDPSLIDADGYLLRCAEIDKATYSAKRTKLLLFENFMKTNKSKYLILFEDDIYIHNNFSKYIGLVDEFIKKVKPMLLYLGINNRKFLDKNFEINKLAITKNKICSGAYGVIINRAIIPYLISYIKDPVNQYKPFDITCLGIIQMSYPNSCYISDPPLVIPDISTSNIRGEYDQNLVYELSNINPNNYILPDLRLFVVYIKDNTKFDLTNRLLKVFRPYYQVIYLYGQNTNNDIIIKECDVKNYIQTNYPNVKYYIYMTDDTHFKYYDGDKIMKIVNTQDNLLKIDQKLQENLFIKYT
jgi:GR25 family glycosyltransferase involved in LPS biosynthesis